MYGATAAVGVILWILDSLSTPVFPLDDAYITAHNAAALVSGHDPSYGVSGLVGATSPLHVLATALFTLVLPAIRALHIVAWLGAIAYALGLLRLAFAHRASIPQALGLLVAGLVVAEVPHHLMNGLETGWMMAALVWTLALASEGTTHGRAVAVLCGLLPLLRPELAVLSALVLLLQASLRWRAAPTRSAAMRAIGLDVAIAAAAALPFIVIMWAATGSPIPITISAKRTFFAEGCLPEPIRRAWTVTHLRSMAGLLGIMSTSVVLLLLTNLGRVGLLSILVLVVAFYEQFPGALAHNQYRYLYPVVPILLYGAASAMNDSRKLLRWASGVIIFGTCGLSGFAAPTAWHQHEINVAFTRDELAAVATWSEEHIPKDAIVLVHDAGYIAYATDLHLVDLVGLKTPGSQSAHAKWTWPTCGRNRGQAVSEIALAAHARYFVVLIDWDHIFGFVGDLLSRGWHLRLLRVTEGRGYQVFEMRPPGPPGP